METSSQPTPQHSTAKIIICVVIVILIGVFVWYFGAYRPKTPGQSGGTAADNTPAATLGGTLYEQANNPIQDKLPATVAPVPNPIQDVYKNPFQ